MLSNTLVRHPRERGRQLLQQRGSGDAHELSAWRLRLDAGDSASHQIKDEETIAVLLEGRGRFSVGDQSWTVSRRGVFAERATALYLPAGQELRVVAESPLEVFLASTPASPGGAAAVVAPDDIRVNTRGRGIYTREVHDIFVTDSHVKRLMVGETFNPAGHWSSYPPHKHDGKNGEPVLEEIYYYRVDPAHGFGHQMLYTNEGESVTHEVRDGDLVLLPYGYHPVSAPPGYNLYYLWAMAGAQRKLALYEDPAHRWIHDLPESRV